MWNQMLERKGIEVSALNKKLQKLIADHQEIQAGLTELEQELAQEQDASIKKEIEYDIKGIRQDLEKLDRQITDQVSMLKKNPDGSLGTMTSAELADAWNNRRNEWIGGEKKKTTQSIF